MTNGKAAPVKPARATSNTASRKRTTIPREPKAEGEGGPLPKNWRAQFLAALAETSNVTAACGACKATPSRAYKARREEPAFARAWRDALYEGYENLEMEVLHRLRNGDAERKHDNANAIRLLAAHRETIARERARRDNRDEQAVLDSIDAMIDQMREQAAANAALLSEDGAEDGSESADGES